MSSIRIDRQYCSYYLLYALQSLQSYKSGVHVVEEMFQPPVNVCTTYTQGGVCGGSEAVDLGNPRNFVYTGNYYH